MPWIRNSFLLIFAIAFLNAGAAQDVDDCATKLVPDRYYSVFRTCLANGLFKVADLQAAAASETPFNPLMAVTPISKNSAAKTVFTQMVAAEDVRALWPQTKLKLATFLEDAGADEANRKDAAALTHRVFAPREILNLGRIFGPLAFTTFDDGTHAIAYVDRRTLTVDALDGNELFSLPMPSGKILTNMEWGRDRQGTLWLYIALRSGGPQPQVRLARLDWAKRSAGFQTIPCDFVTVKSKLVFKDIGPGWFLLEISSRREPKRTFNLANGQLELIPELIIGDGQTEAIDRDGKLVARLPGEKREIVFTTLDGRTLRATSHKDSVLITDLHNPSLQIQLALEAGQLDQMAFVDAGNGHVFLATVNKSAPFSRTIRIFDPFHSHDPLYTYTNKGLRLKSLRWFRDVNGSLILSYEGVADLKFINPTEKWVETLARQPYMIFYTHGSDAYISGLEGPTRKVISIEWKWPN